MSVLCVCVSACGAHTIQQGPGSFLSLLQTRWDIPAKDMDATLSQMLQTIEINTDKIVKPGFLIEG